MSAVVDVAVPVFAIMLAGFLAGRFRILGASSSEALNAFVYWFALPPVLFLSMATVPLSDVFNWPFIWTIILGMAAVALPSTLIAKFLFPNSFSGLTLHGLTSVFANTGYMGIPLFIAAFGPTGTLPAVIATAINSVLIIGLTVLFVEIGSGSGKGPRQAVGGALLAVVRGPLFIAPVAGILWSASGLGLPVWLSNFAGLMGDASGPCALFAMGLFLVGKPISTGLGEVSWLVIAKLALHPLITWVLAVQVFHLDAEFTRGAVLMAALPTGALSFVIAQKYGVFVQRSSAAILLSTVFSVVTVSALLAWFGTS
ncbi:MAG: AEC family transporter [Alphaproteobacteria bacterium]|nr:AEC family transporter [Alphaproteobacteria bacterium]